MKPFAWLGRLLLPGLLLAPQAQAQRLFSENFEEGGNPFGFDSYIAGADARGEPAKGGPRGRIWMTRFQPGEPGRFGHRLLWKEDWPATDTLYWAGYLRFGFEDGRPLWKPAGETPYELRLPELGGESGPFGRFRRHDQAGREGRFELVTADGRVHAPSAAQPLVSNRWYLIQFALEDRGEHDRVRIWINNDREAQPDYEYAGGDMVDARAWSAGMPIDHGRRLHQVGADSRLYYDEITLATDFIKLPVPQAIPPEAPKNLRIDDNPCPEGKHPVPDPRAPAKFRCA